MKIIIITNHRPRELKEYHELPEAAQSDFDYVDKEDPGGYRFFCYRGEWYDASEFCVIPDVLIDRQPALGNWAGYASDSFFSGLVIKFTNDFEEVIVGRYTT